jgi:hypothetical protein
MEYNIHAYQSLRTFKRKACIIFVCEMHLNIFYGEYIYVCMYSDVNLNENSLFEVLPFGCIKL